MVDYSTLLKTWGDNGVEYPTGYSYLEGEQPVDDWDNFLISNIIGDLDHLVDVTNKRIESDSGVSGDEPDNPDGSHLYYDTDNETLNFWNSNSGIWVELLSSDLSGQDLTDSGTVIWDSSGGEVPQDVLGGPASSLSSYPLPAGDLAEDYALTSRFPLVNSDLSNSAVTVTAGNQLSGGGSVDLGGSVTVDVDDGAGSGLDADLLDGNEATAFALDSEVSPIQASSDVNHDNITGVSANDHHTDPTAGTGLTDEGDNQFGIATNGVGQDEFDAAEYVIENPNVMLPLTALEDGESIEKFVRVDDGDTITVHFAEALIRDSSSTGGSTGSSNLYAEILDENDTVVNTETYTSESVSGLITYTNTSGVSQYYGLRISNGTGSPIDSPGAFGNFGVVIE